LRYLSAPADDADAAARSLSQKQFYLRDGLFRTIRVLSILREKGQSLRELSASLPDSFVQRKVFGLSFSPAKLLSMFRTDDSAGDTLREGVSLKRGDGRLLVTPTRDGDALRVLAEAHSMEAAQEMCSGFERLLREMEDENTNAE
jgi:mannose-1-phosphate guanylyltransferase/phosphomannomutase